MEMRRLSKICGVEQCGSAPRLTVTVTQPEACHPPALRGRPGRGPPALSESELELENCPNLSDTAAADAIIMMMNSVTVFKYSACQT